ncbi:MAG: AmmeMemoRadiSam system protein B [Patescibacteria group bacterium]|nr:AmmeMemoRadiSam system protein B [Patescibacteria group bacterium]
MALVFAGIAAHTPLLLPTISKENLALVEKTRQAMQQMAASLEAAKPETIIVISPHGPALPDAVVINVNQEYASNFEEFGDLMTKMKWRADIMLADRVREDFKLKHLPLALDSADRLDYGTAVPLFYLTPNLPQTKIIPMVPAQLDMRAHFNIGRELKDEIMSATTRVAVIASADLSHCVGEQSPEGLNPRGVALDEKVISLIEANNPVGILDVDEPWATEAKACGLKGLGILAGLMDDVHFETRILSYEKPVGVGYLVAEMRIG